MKNFREGRDNVKKSKKRTLCCIEGCRRDGKAKRDAGLPLAFPYCEEHFDKMVHSCRSRSW
jgi:hypothetical protein